jgi:hypothetical protein
MASTTGGSSAASAAQGIASTVTAVEKKAARMRVFMK